MKKIVFFAILTIIGVIKVSAQQVDILQENYADTRIEELTQEVAELSERLDKLQEDYEYLALVNQLKDLCYEVKIFTNNVKIRTNEIVVRCYNSSFDIDLYLLDKDTYDLFQNFYDHYSQKRDDFSKQISNLTFSNEKQYNINILYNILNSDLRSFDNCISGYKQYLDIYKKMGKGF